MPGASAGAIDTCAQAGAMHGHLDFLKKVGDPATGPPSRSQGFGFVTFSSGETSDRVAGVLRIKDVYTTVFVAQDGVCTLEGDSVALMISLRNVRTGEEVQLEARADHVEGPGTYPAVIRLDPSRGGIDIVGVLVLVFAR